MTFDEYEDLNHRFAKSIGEEYTDELIYNFKNIININAEINPNKTLEPYFKFLKIDHDKQQIYVARISMISPRYIKTEYEDYELTNEEIDFLLDTLVNKTVLTFCCYVPEKELEKYLPKYQYVLDSDEVLPVWQAIIFKMNDLHILYDHDWWDVITYDLPIPNYNLLKKE